MSSMSGHPTGSPANLADAFAVRAREHPDRVAVSARDGQLTYRDLDGSASRVAAALATHGVGRDSVVVLFTGRTTSLITGILAILKAGGAYLPVEPSHPGERTADLIRATGARAVVTTSDLLDRVRSRPDLCTLAPVVLDDLPAVPPDGRAGRRVARHGSSLAYVLTTSGSTGEPKAVQVEDRNVLSLVAALHEAILAPLGGDLRLALVAPQVFDASVQQIFPALLLGHTLVIVPEAVRAAGPELRQFWADERIDVSDGTPAHLRMTAEARDRPRIPVRHLLIGGDLLTPGVVRQFLAECARPDVTVTNVYGVAECCVDSLAGRADPDEPYDSVPIGSPLPGTIVELLDDDLLPVPDGEIGEIHIGGSGVGRGYLGREDLNARLFYTRTGRTGRYYRTGDLARRLPDGRLVFAGRADRQFKVRGHRVEPAEIEAAVRRYAGAAPAAVAGGDGASAEACRSCLLTSAYPGVTVTDGVCSVCHAYAGYRDEVARYFGTPSDLVDLIHAHNRGRDPRYDVLLLFSGGKDSTYALYRLLDEGFKVLAFTFDNGYISKAAFSNIRRITTQLGVDLEIGSAPAMNEVFVESLRAESSVCGGCFRGLTAMSTRLAVERDVRVVVTGLSRGQIFDTKLRRLVESGVRDPVEIDQRLKVHRVLYHARQDRTSDLLALPVAPSDLDCIQFVDYFRYDNVTTQALKQYLISKDKLWEQPADTGLCSTNCRINEVGIYVHTMERGFHNYASPLSWDCRLGVLDRMQGMREIATLAPPAQISGMLRKLGYTPQPRRTTISEVAVVLGPPGAAQPQICAYYASDHEIDGASMREHLATRLPDYMIPAHLVRVGELPLTGSGKVDLAALPDPGTLTPPEAFQPPCGPFEERIAEIWQETLGIARISRDKDFFEAGGDSLTATIVAGLLQVEFGTSLPVAELFSFPTIAEAGRLLAEAVAGPDDPAGTRGSPEPGAGSEGPDPVLLGPGTATGGVFLLPDVWGSVEGYRELAGRIEGPVWGLPAAVAREQDLPDIDANCRRYARQILDRAGAGQLCLGGWSFGGILAFGTAHHIHALGGRVGHLVIVDTLPVGPAYWSEQADICRAYLDAPGVRDEVPFEVRRVLPPGATLGPEAVRGYAQRIMPVLRALAAYQPPAGAAADRVTFLRAESSGLTAAHARRWEEFAPGRFTAHVVPGDHFSVLSADHAGAVARHFARPAGRDGYAAPAGDRPPRGPAS